MALSQSLFSAITGLINHQTRLDNVGNNLANINTVGYKRSVLSFQDVLSQTVRGGMAPDLDRGGTNPLQMGLGVQVASVTADFGQGALEFTGRQSDLALEGDGFFKVVAGTLVRYTRDGAFTLSSAGELVTANGFRVQGWMADANGIIDTTAATEAILIPLGERRLARETGNVAYTGNLNSSGSVAGTGTVLDSYQLASSNAGAAAGAGTALTSLYYNDGSGWQQMFAGLAVGDTITVAAVKGNRTITQGIAYTGQDLGTFVGQLREALGIQTIAGSGDAGAGVQLSAGANPTIQVTGNLGEMNAISQLEFTHNSVTQGIFTESTAADGEGAVTSTIVYDSLGNEHLVTMTMALVDRTDTSSTWRWYADCLDDTDLDLAVGTGTVVFDTRGQFASESGDPLRVDLNLQGVDTQLMVDPDFELLTQFASLLGSELNVRSQDGAPMGTLTDYAFGEDGTITGLYSNGLTEELGRLTVTRFANDNGLLRDASNMYAQGVNSGVAQDGEAMASGRGTIRAGTLESSNVDIAREFTDMIVTQRGFQANARTITASDEMLQELINLSR